MDNVKSPATETVDKERFKVTDMATANWVFRQLGKADATIEQRTKEKEAMDQQNQEWFDRETKDALESREYFTGLLEEFRLTLPDGKLKTPAGSATVRHSTKFDYKDDELLTYLKSEHPEFVKKVESSKWGDFKKTLRATKDGKVITKDDGEVIPFMKAHVTESVSYKADKIYTTGGGFDE